MGTQGIIFLNEHHEVSSTPIHIIGGGLSSCFLLHLLKTINPELKVRLYDSKPSLDGNHTWCFHKSDISKRVFDIIQPMISKQWDKHEVQFGNSPRVFKNGAYCSITSSKMDEFIRNNYPDSIELNRTFQESEIHSLDGLVFDGRGWPKEDLSNPSYRRAFQKFVGIDVKLEAPHGLTHPTLMDTNIEQIDGYRFMYLLPWDEQRLLIEDTYYSDTSDLDKHKVADRIQSYVQNQGWKIQSVERIESGCLPLPLENHLGPSNERNIFSIGARAGLLNSTTGYTLPETLNFYDQLVFQFFRKSSLDEKSLEGNIQSLFKTYFKKYQSNQRFYQLLNRMLFLASAPKQRLEIMKRFYTLPVGTIERFYGGRLRMSDKLKILALRPPVPLSKAVKCLSEKTEVTYG